MFGRFKYLNNKVGAHPWLTHLHFQASRHTILHGWQQGSTTLTNWRHCLQQVSQLYTLLKYQVKLATTAVLIWKQAQLTRGDRICKHSKSYLWETRLATQGHQLGKATQGYPSNPRSQRHKDSAYHLYHRYHSL
mgnify:CR=1 FL=1